jgi:hypothetical protein
VQILEADWGELTIGWNTRTIKLKKSWGFESGLGVKICLKDLGSMLLVLNVYGPYHECVPLWESFLNITFMNSDGLILRNDLNFSMGVAEIWGPRARPDPLSDFFSHIMGENVLIDVALTKHSPTWRNKRVGEDQIAKRINHFFRFKEVVGDPTIDKRMGRMWR